MWSIDDAVAAIGALVSAAGELEYVGQPCRTPDELAAVRRSVDVAIAADVSMAEAADVAILRCSPLGGVRRALRMAEKCGLPCVVASENETSIGLASGLALAGALAELPFACALGTVSSLSSDLVGAQRSLFPVDGYLPVAPTAAAPDRELLVRYALTDSDRVARWRERLVSARIVA
jgi:O-succinylbenzoate synthase